MSEFDFPGPDVDVESMDPETLKARIDAGEPVTVLDTRVKSEYEEWAIDGESVESVCVPYFLFLDGPDDELLERVPDGDPLVVVCARGHASEYVAGVLTAESGMDAVTLAGGMNGWAEIYERTEIEGYGGPGRLFQYHRPSSGCLGYLVVSADGAAVIDPLRAFTDRYLADAEELDATLQFALDTHVHADHVSGVRALDDEGVEGVLPAPAAARGVTDDDVLALVDDGDTLAVGDVTIEAIHAPGHTTGMTAYRVGDSFLATGDGLFVESVARPDLEDGDEGATEAARQLYETLQERILALPDETLIGGGHVSDAAEPAGDGTYTATLSQLVAEMDPLTDDQAAFVERVLADVPPRPANYEEIIATNLGQQTVDDETAFELELGPNNCAASRDALSGD